MTAHPGEINVPAVRLRYCGNASPWILFEQLQTAGHELMAEWFVAKTSEMQDGDRRIVTAGQREIGVFHKDGAYYAYSNTCLHQGGPACEGLLINNVVDIVTPDRLYHGQTFGDDVHFVCPWHGWEYDIKSGECIGDREQKLRKFEVVQRGDEIYVVA